MVGTELRGLAAPEDRLCVGREADGPASLAPRGLPMAAMRGLPGGGDRNMKNKTNLSLYYHIFCPVQNCCSPLNPCKTFAAISLPHLLTYHGFGGLFSLLL